MREGFLLVLIGLTSAGAWAVGARRLGLDTRALGAAAGRLLESLGVIVIFLAANLLVAGFLILTARSVGPRFVSLYLVDDVVVLHIMMPRLGGVQALRHIHAFDPRITVVVVSGVADADLLRQASLAGASACLTKPAAFAEIAAALRGRLPPPRRGAGRVLVVDDEREVRE